MNLNDTIYAVTDQHVLLELVVTEADSNFEDLEGWTKVSTKLADETAKRHAKSHHQAYFAEFFLDSEGAPNRSSIYKYKANAVEAANIAIKQELTELEARRAALLTKQANLAALTEA